MLMDDWMGKREKNRRKKVVVKESMKFMLRCEKKTVPIEAHSERASTALLLIVQCVPML